MNMYGSDLGTWQGCLVAHSAGLTPVPSHHLLLNWWAEGQCHTALTWAVLKTTGGENRGELLPVHFVWLPESLFGQ